MAQNRSSIRVRHSRARLMFVKSALVFIAGLCSFGCAAAQDVPASKIALLEHTQAVQSRLLALAQKCSAGECRKADSSDLDHSHVQLLVAKALEDVTSLDALRLTAIFALTSADHQSAGDESVDRVYDVAWTQSILKMSASKDVPRALEALNLIQQRLRLDGAGGLLIEESKLKLKKKLQQSKGR
jgi:hypothetical protein